MRSESQEESLPVTKPPISRCQQPTSCKELTKNLLTYKEDKLAPNQSMELQHLFHSITWKWRRATWMHAQLPFIAAHSIQMLASPIFPDEFFMTLGVRA